MGLKIDMLVPPLSLTQFSGGTWCLMQYALGLARLGHDVRVVPMAPSPRPEWVPEHANLSFVQETGERSGRIRQALSRFLRTAFGALLKRRPGEIKAAFVEFSLSYFSESRQLLPFAYYRATAQDYFQRQAREVNVVIATFFETALAAAYYPAQRRLYFCQHMEALFYKEMYGGEQSRTDAELSYRLGLELVANSSWLREQLKARGLNSLLCCNAINHEYFTPPAVARAAGESVVLISYGGRQVDWKGFEEMAHAVARARRACPELRIEWKVYGGAALPPDNSVAPYEALGFLQQPQLGDAYRSADIMLSASWYESFPLFPLEAMACGIAAIVTAPGTEDFARHLDTAYVVEAKNPASVAEGIVALARDPALRQRIAASGQREALNFTWEKSVQRMNEIIVQGAS